MSQQQQLLLHLLLLLLISASVSAAVDFTPFSCRRQDVIEGDYSQLLASSIFCLVLPGDGWSARMDDAMLHGCIPVIIMVRGMGGWGDGWQ